MKKTYLVIFGLALAFIGQSQPMLQMPSNEAMDINVAPTLEWAGNAASYTVEVYACSPAGAPVTSIELENFEWISGPDTIKEIYGDLSGLTFNPLTETFFAPSNGIPMIFEISPEGEHIRTITLQGFEDTEGLVWIGGETYFVIEERRGRAVKITINDNTTSIDYLDEYIQLSGTWGNNLGIEGVAYDAAKNRLLIVKEKFPVALYSFEIPAVLPDTIEPDIPFDIASNNFQCSDFSGLHYLPELEKLLILSHETQTLIETTLSGAASSRLELNDEGAGGSLSDGLFQAEGISIDNQGNICVVSEPNTFYKFSNPNPPIPFDLAELVISENISGSTNSVITYTTAADVLMEETQYCWRVKDNYTGEWSEIWTFTTAKDTTTSVENVELSGFDVQLFPNPLKDLLTLSWQSLPVNQQAQIYIYDTQGNQVLDKAVPSTDTNIVLDIGQLAAGIYIITFEIEGERVSKTFLKQ